MPLLVNLRHLEEKNLRVDGELEAEELDMDARDEVIEVKQPLEYDLEVQMLEEGLLVHGKLSLKLDCKCVRCLKPFQANVELPDWSLHLPFQGEEAVPVTNDCVDLTPFLREDMLLEFPQHPLCDPECRGLSFSRPGKPSDSSQDKGNSSAWAELNKLKLKD